MELIPCPAGTGRSRKPGLLGVAAGVRPLRESEGLPPPVPDSSVQRLAVASIEQEPW